MASSALSSAISTIGDLLTEEAKYLWGVEEQVERLQTELQWMESFLSLKDADARQGEDKRIRMWVSEIRELAYDAEDVVEAFALQIVSKRKAGLSNVIKKSACILKEGRLLHKTRSKIESIIARIADLTRRLQTYGIRELKDAQSFTSSNIRRELRWTYPHIVEDHNIVGLSNETKKLVSILVDHEHNHHKVVSICGMGGLGKTTLAKKLYNHSRVRENFTHFAWVYVSEQCQKRKVWEDALSGLNVVSDDELRNMREDELAGKLFNFLKDNQSSMNDERLAKKLFDFLKDNKCLVILDDLWSIEDWNVIRHGFPTDEPQSKSKVLITFRNKELALPGGYLHALECLNEKESLELFQKIAFQNSPDKKADGGKEELGEIMVKHCAGLPLAIVVLGGILATKDSFNEWEKVHENVKSYFKKRGKWQQSIDEVLALSYDDLPPYLRPCFLYLSHFPEDYEINAQRLIQLWVAEGIVSSKQGGGNGEEILEDVAEGYLVELAERCMIQVRETDIVETSKIKTFQMHDLMRDLCLSMAKQENFIFIFHQSNADSLSTISRVRRVSAHVFFWIQRIKSPNIRSLLFFSQFLPEDLFENLLPLTVRNYCEKHERELWNPVVLILGVSLACMVLSKIRGIWAHIFNNFKLLRVLDFEGEGKFAGCKIPSDIGNLIHLRFLSLRGLMFTRSKLPSSLGNLRCLQTLDLRISEEDYSDSIHVPNVIWRMEQLRHLYLPWDWKCKSKTKLKLDTLRNLQTLVNFNTKTCYVKHLFKLTNLRELEIRGQFKIEDFNSPIVASKCLHTLSIFSYKGIDPRHLAHLLSSCDRICKLSLRKVKIDKLPEYHYFSQDITYIHLSLSINLDEDPIPTLEKLPKLRILQIGDSAFRGKKMICSAGGFHRLESLSLKGLGNLEELQVDESAMPVQRRLEIVNCRKMKMLSDGLSFITTLQELAIKSMPKAFKDKLVEEGEDFHKVKHVPSITFQDCDKQ